MQFAFRSPQFPVIVNAERVLFAAHTPEELERRFSEHSVPRNLKPLIIDSTAEVFLLHEHVVLPSLQRRRTKAAIIKVYNDNRPNNLRAYPITSLGSKPVQRVISDLVSLLTESESGAL